MEVTYDGINFNAPSIISIPVSSTTDKNPYNQKFTQVLESDKTLKVKGIRYTIVNPGNCPEWHLGKGNPTWLFLDELIFN
jgi:hypothetical protein